MIAIKNIIKLEISHCTGKYRGATMISATKDIKCQNKFH